MAILLSILLKLVLLRDPLLVLPLYTSMIFQMMFSVLLITMLVKLLSTPSMIRLRFVVTIRVGFWTWMWPKKHLWTGTGNGLLTSKLGKLNFFQSTIQTTVVLLIWKWMDLFMMKSVFTDAGIDSLLNWIGTLTLSIATASQKIVLRFDVSNKTFF